MKISQIELAYNSHAFSDYLDWHWHVRKTSDISSDTLGSSSFSILSILSDSRHFVYLISHPFYTPLREVSFISLSQVRRLRLRGFKGSVRTRIGFESKTQLQRHVLLTWPPHDSLGGPSPTVPTHNPWALPPWARLASVLRRSIKPSCLGSNPSSAIH